MAESTALQDAAKRAGLRAIMAWMPRARRRHLYLSLALMALGGIAEMISIGAALPFLAVVSDPERAQSIPAVAFIFRLMGWAGGDDVIVPAVALLIGAALFAAAVRLALTWVSQKFVLHLGHDMGMEIYRRMVRQPYSFYVTRNTSQMIAGVEKIEIVIFAALLPLMQAVVATVVATAIVLMLVLIDPWIALMAAASVASLYIAVSIAARTLLRENSRVVSETQTARIKQIQEGLGGIREILLDQSQAVFEEEFRRLDLQFRRSKNMNLFVSAAPRFVVEAAGIILLALLALYMAQQPGGILGAIPVIGALALGAQRLLPLMQQIYNGWSQATGSLYVVGEVVALMQAPLVASRPRDLAAPVVPFRRDIVLDGVGFAYAEASRPALHKVDLKIAKGERIGFLGKTGSGKSTLLDLVMGLLEPTQGAILIDGVPLDDRSRSGWQAQIAHVPQSVYLSDGSIAANIAFGVTEDAIDRERVLLAARQAQIDGFVEQLPDGYATVVGERGVRLSGGQRQRIGLARALYKRATVLVLDEATSALDSATEAAVMESIEALGPELTVLMIAHRLSTLSGCDRLVRLDKGRIAEIGRYDDLVGGSEAAVLSVTDNH